MPEMIFKLDEQQVADARKWMDEHPCKLRDSKYTGAIGGKATYTFTNTTIGQIQNVECACGEEHCLTDDL